MLRKLTEIFSIEYPKTMIFSEQELDPVGFPFVSSSGENNGVVGYIKNNAKNKLYKSGAITVPLKGSVLDAFYQPKDFYIAHQIAVLYPRNPMTEKELLFYTLIIRRNKFRFSYGRQADKTLKDILIPASVPMKFLNLEIKKPSRKPIYEKRIALSDRHWKWFRYDELFELYTEKFVAISEAEEIPGNIPFVSTGSENNGIACMTGVSSAKTYPAGCLTVASSGNAGEVFYQEKPFKVTNMVIILYPKLPINKFVGLFLASLIRKEKYRYSYGRKSGLERMRESKMKLPVDASGNPDWDFMENFIKSLPYSAEV